MAQGNRGNADAAIAFVATIVLQIALGFAVLQLRPQAHLPVASDDAAIRVEFLARANHRAASDDIAMATSPSVSAGPEATTPASRVTDGAEPRGEVAAPTSEPRALDLHVEDPEQAPRFEPREAFGRMPVLDARRTRFEHAWAPAGTALEQARFRSKAVGVALALFGGPGRPCTEVERRLHKPDCLALQGEALEDELARNEAIAK